MPEFNPTEEQQMIADAAGDGDDLVVGAGAGTGKTRTLRYISEVVLWDKKGLYVPYNKATQLEAAASFPNNISSRTQHSLAYASMSRGHMRRNNNKIRMPGRMAASILGIKTPYSLEDSDLSPAAQARLVMDAIRNFSHSASQEPSEWNIPTLDGVNPDMMDNLKESLMPYVNEAWTDIKSPAGRLKFEPDHYLKMWQLSNPILPYDVIMLDEAQDSNPVIMDVIIKQLNRGTQVILVGDQNQQLYAWRGAEDAMEHFPGKKLYLSQSFRFGEAVAEEANKWLNLLDSPLQLKGFDQITSVVGTNNLLSSDAILCRTNAGCVQAVMSAQMQDISVALVGGGRDIQSFAEAAIDLMAGKKSEHPQLVAFGSWNDLRQYVNEDAGGSDLKVLVQLIDKLGPETVINAMENLSSEEKAELTVSTGHRAKGREWNRVKISEDFNRGENVAPEVMPSRPSMMLGYVAVTRAQFELDRGGLAYVDGVRKE